MKLLFFIFLSFLFTENVIAQDSDLDSLLQYQKNRIIEKPEIVPLNAEKLAWEMMLPYNYKKQEKSSEMKSFEQMFLHMKSGVGELTLMIGEFELKTFEKISRTSGKK